MTDDVYAPPGAAAHAPSRDGEAIRRAGELGFTTMILLGANACCGVLVFLVPFTGGLALLQIRGLEPETEVDRLWMRIAKTGGWMGVTLGGTMMLVLVGYIFMILVYAMVHAPPSSL